MTSGSEEAGRGKLGKNWLADTLREATSDYAMSFHPKAQTVATLSGAVSTPLDPGDAQRLRRKLAKRYAAWTGRDLGDDLAQDAGRAALSAGEEGNASSPTAS